MSSNWDVGVLDGRIWFVGAHSIFGEPKHYPGETTQERAEVIVPICQLDGLTAEQIGNTVLELVPVARACFAAHLASAYDTPAGQDYYKRAPDEIVVDMVYEDLPYLEGYLGSEYVNQEKLLCAVSFLRDLRARYEVRVRAKKTGKKVPAARKVVARDYNSIFMRIGRRDGFHCGCCSTTQNLQLDHITPVSCDGGSEDSNLQLLCASCNSRKGDSTVDYRRKTTDAQETQNEPDLHSEQPAITEDMSGTSN